MAISFGGCQRPSQTIRTSQNPYMNTTPEAYDADLAETHIPRFKNLYADLAETRIPQFKNEDSE
jgi:hypothetical protein